MPLHLRSFLTGVIITPLLVYILGGILYGILFVFVLVIIFLALQARIDRVSYWTAVLIMAYAFYVITYSAAFFVLPNFVSEINSWLPTLIVPLILTAICTWYFGFRRYPKKPFEIK
jgi:hypothetical protein